jgi:apolipoprotein N-acyltransferase
MDEKSKIENQTPAAGAANPSKILLLSAGAAASGVLMAMVFSGPRWGFLAAVAPVPLLLVLRGLKGAFRHGGLAAAAAGFLMGLFYNGISIGWIRNVEWFVWPPMAAYLSLFTALFAWSYYRVAVLGHCAPAGLASPVIWAACEMARSRFIGGFPWNLAGHGAIDFLPLAQTADIWGVCGLSMIALGVSAALYEWSALFVFTSEKQRSATGRLQVRRAVITTIVWTFAVVGGIAYGLWRMSSLPLVDGPRIAALQGNRDTRGEYDADKRRSELESRGDFLQAKRIRKEREDYAKDTFRAYSRLHREAARQSPRPDLIIWPETMCSGALNEDIELQTADERIDPHRRDVAELVAESKTRAIVGADTVDVHGDPPVADRYNTLFYYGPDGRQPSAGSLITDGQRPPSMTYEKTRLVPFGEYVPWTETLPFMKILGVFTLNYTPGRTGIGVYPLHKSGTSVDAAHESRPDWQFSMTICFEDAFPDMHRQAAGMGADFVINCTNDGWYGQSAELAQHLTLARFRAIETRLAMVRVTNTGMSAVIDPLGRIEGRTIPPYAEGRLEAVVPLAAGGGRGRTVYAAAGDLLCWAAAACAAALTAWTYMRKSHKT